MESTNLLPYLLVNPASGSQLIFTSVPCGRAVRLPLLKSDRAIHICKMAG